MKEDIVNNAIICLSRMKIEDITYQVARDIVLEELEEKDKEIERLKKEVNKHIKEGIEKDIRINNALEYINDGSVFDGSSMCSNDLRLLLSGIIVRSDKE